ncbi:MAG: gfo/Idh/MocA family oxidoreductase, partial [Spirochaetaceae bacterium]
MSVGSERVRVVVVGAGSMGSSHARAYHANPGFELAGIVAPSSRRRGPLAAELGTPEFASLDDAIDATAPDAVCIASYPDTHYDYARRAIEAGMHVFVEKPLATTVDRAEQIVSIATERGVKVVVGYILRVHPAWTEFIRIARTLGTPLVMRMNLNQQSDGAAWETHKALMKSMSPIVDCGVHYVDVMCQMTRSRPVRVQAIGARLTDEIDPDMYNYGHLHVVFEDGSVGWYEAGWGPMMSETAFFVKDVVGPGGSVSIVDPSAAAARGPASADIDAHTKTNALLVHRVASGGRDAHDELIDMSEEPDHQALCDREQAFFLNAIRTDADLSEHLADAVNSL